MQGYLTGRLHTGKGLTDSPLLGTLIPDPTWLGRTGIAGP